MCELFLKLTGEEASLKMVSGVLAGIGVSVVEIQDAEDKQQVLDALISTLENFRTRLLHGSLVKEVKPDMSRQRFHELALAAGWKVKSVVDDYYPDKQKYPDKRYKNVTYEIPGHGELRFALSGDVAFRIRVDHRYLLASHLQSKGL